MTAPFVRIVVIVNPQSSGDGPQLAEQLHADLTRRSPEVPVHLCPTDRAGHAREAAQTGHPLIVSVSGDGGYNEVVDGVRQAGNDHAVCAVQAAGNANDHRRTTAQRPIADAIAAGEVRRIDLLRLTVRDGGTLRRNTPTPTPDPGDGHRPGEGRQGLAQADRVRGSDLRQVPALHHPARGTAPGAASTACCSPTSPRWPSTPPSARPDPRTTDGST